MSNLVLTRRKGDSVVIYKDNKVICKLTVTSLGSKQTKLAFEASNDIQIDREELYISKHNNP